MKKNKNIKLFLLLVVPIFLGSFLTFVKVSNAQGACTVLPPVFRTTKPGGPPTPGGGTATSPTFYQADDRPFVYIDIHTQNCMNQHIRISLIGATGNAVDAMTNKDYWMGPDTGNHSEFTIPTIAGEENCVNGSAPECRYHLSFSINGGVAIVSSINFNYNCEGTPGPLSNYCIDGGDWQVHSGNLPKYLFFGSDLGGAGGVDSHGSTGILGGTISTGGGGDTTGNPGNGNASTSSGPIILHITNPLEGTVDSIPQFFQTIVNIIIKVAVPIVAMAIIYSGLLFVTARGDTAQLEKARHAFTFAIIGGLILLASWLIAEAIKDALTSLAYIM